MRTQLSIALASFTLLALAAPAQAIIGGHPLDVERSGFVSLQTAASTCGAVVLQPDLLLGSALCFPPSVVQHPELVGWNMGTQDSDDNPVREIAIDRSRNFALIRLTSPLVGLGANQFSIYRGNAADLSTVRCFAFGPRDFLQAFPTGATLSHADFGVSGPAANLALAGPLLNAYDMGGACLTVDGTNQIAAIIKSSTEIVSATLARAFVTEVRTSFELISAASNLCVGNVPNGSRVWQFACAAGGSSLRQNQQWMIRRVYPDGRFQLRSTRFPDACLGVVGASTADGAAVHVAPCAPDIVDQHPAALPTAPRIDQLWDVEPMGDDQVRLVNVGSQRCLDVPSTALGTMLVQSTCATWSSSQRFVVNADRFPAGAHRIAAYADPAQCLDVAFWSHAAGAAIHGWYCHGGDNQQFDLAAVGTSPLQQVRRAWPDVLTCLAIDRGDAAPGIGAVQWPCGPWLDLQWRFRWTPGIYGFRLQPQHGPSLCLTRPALPAGSQVIQATCEIGPFTASYDAQRWIVE